MVELVIVVAILAILVGILAPQYTKYVEKSRKAADATNLDEMVKVVKIYAADPVNELPVGEYVITISNNGTVIDNGANASAEAIAALTELRAEMDATIPLYTERTLKSQKWGDGGAYSPVTATVLVAADGGTSTTYSPTAMENYVARGSEDAAGN